MPNLRIIPNPSGLHEQVTIYGTGFCQTPMCGSITLTANGDQIKSGIAVDSSGAFSVSFSPGAAGEYSVVASQTDSSNKTIYTTTGMTVAAADYPPAQQSQTTPTPHNLTQQLPSTLVLPQNQSPLTNFPYAWLVFGCLLVAAAAIYVIKSRRRK